MAKKPHADLTKPVPVNPRSPEAHFDTVEYYKSKPFIGDPGYPSQSSRYANANATFGIPYLYSNETKPINPGPKPAKFPYTLFKSQQNMQDQLPSVRNAGRFIAGKGRK